jgi:hypothetical protein
MANVVGEPPGLERRIAEGRNVSAAADEVKMNGYSPEMGRATPQPRTFSVLE